MHAHADRNVGSSLGQRHSRSASVAHAQACSRWACVARWAWLAWCTGPPRQQRGPAGKRPPTERRRNYPARVPLNVARMEERRRGESHHLADPPRRSRLIKALVENDSAALAAVLVLRVRQLGTNGVGQSGSTQDHHCQQDQSTHLSRLLVGFTVIDSSAPDPAC